MKKLSFLLIGFLLFSVSCTKQKKDITIDDYINMQKEIWTTDSTPAAKEKIAEKYGFTLKQYLDFEKLAENDQAIREKVQETFTNQKNTLK